MVIKFKIFKIKPHKYMGKNVNLSASEVSF